MFGVWAPNEDVAKLAYYGLYALQHRGQESAGIAVSDGSRIVVHKEMGLVAQVFDEPALTALRGHIAVGHCRYSTTGASVWANAQPTFRSTGTVSLALGHNGNLINTRELAAPARPGAGAGQHRHRGDVRHRRAHRAVRQRPGRARPSGQGSPRWRTRPRLRPAAGQGGLLAGLHGRADPVRGAGPARLPAAGARPPGHRLGGGQRDGRAGHRGGQVRARDRARRARLHRRAGGAVPDLRRGRSRAGACSSTSTWPGRTPRSPAGGCTPPGSRSAGGSPPSIPRTPTWSSRCPSRGRPRRSASPRPAASRSARGWSRTPTWAGPSSSPARPSGSGASS